MKTTVLINLEKGIVTHTSSEILKVKLESEGFISTITVNGRDLSFFKADKLEYLESRKALSTCMDSYKKEKMFYCTFMKKGVLHTGQFYADNLKTAKEKANEWHGKNLISVGKNTDLIQPTPKWVALSPDGVTLSRDIAHYKTKALATAALAKWIKSYEHQGYYSYNFKRIPLNELKYHCVIKQIK